MMFPAGQSVTLIRRTLRVDGGGHPVRDDYGNDLYTATNIVVAGCAVWTSDGNASGANEDVQGRDTVISGLVVVFPVGTAVAAVDQVSVDGVVHDVTGATSSWQSPFTGTAVGPQVHLKRVTG